MEGSTPPQSSVAAEVGGVQEVGGEVGGVRHRNSDQKFDVNHLVGTHWTNEKHNEYLEAMESSFVDQLYNSFNLRGALIQKDYSSDSKFSRQMHVSTRIPTGQFKVHRDGCWTKINAKRGESPSSKTYVSQDISVNPWVRHYKSGRRDQSVTSPHFQGKNALVSMIHLPMCHADSDGSSTEVTDQNFVDEDPDKEVASQTSIINKMKTPVAATPISDQIVPCKELKVTEDVGKPISQLKD